MSRPRRRSLFAAAWLLLGATASLSQTVSGSIDSKESRLSYTGEHPLHAWTGISRSVQGSVAVDPADPSSARVEIVVPVESFDSGNDNRDSNMLDVVEVDRFPTVRFVSDRVEVSSWQPDSGGRWLVHGTLTFHGKSRPVTIPVDVRLNGQTLRAEAAFSVMLDQFGVKRPRLLLRPISNEIKMEGQLVARLSASS